MNNRFPWMVVTFLFFVCCCGASLAAEKDTGGNSADTRLNIKDFQIFNGEKGVELWRLNATFGNIVKNGDEVELDAPKIRYALGEPGDENYLYVVADKGLIKDQQRIVELWGNVSATRGTEHLSTDRIHYDSATKDMTFPDGAIIETSGGRVNAKVLRWNLEKNVLIATDGVTTDIHPQETPVNKNNGENAR